MTVKALGPVVYIMGTGRSGSTVLQALLANASNATGLGEVTHILRDGLRREQPCSCGKDVASCPIWSKLMARFPDDRSTARALQLRDQLEKHSSFPRQVFGLVRAETWQNYAALTAEVFESVRPDGNTLIDSSKYAARAHALKKAHGDSVKIIWLTRSPRGLLESFRKRTEGEQPPKSPPRALLYYVFVTFCARFVALRFPSDVMQVRYEDLLADPRTELTKIGTWARLDMRPAVEAVDAGHPLPLGHVVTGNRLRKAGPLRLMTPAPPVESDGVAERVTLVLMNTWRRLVGA